MAISDVSIPIIADISMPELLSRGLVTEQLDKNVNSDYSELNPLLSPDGKTLYFSRKNHPENMGGVNDKEDIWYSELGPDGKWALAKNMGGKRVRAWSAGTFPLGEIIPETHAALREHGVTPDGQWSKGLRDVPVDTMDVVVEMGPEVHCPAPPSFKGRVVEWNIPDPYGHNAEFFRSVFDLIEEHVGKLLDDLDPRPEAGGGT